MNGLLLPGFACAALLTGGCQQTPVEVSEVLNHGMCQTLRTGLTVISQDELPDIRGARLLNAPANDGRQGKDGGADAADEDVLIAVSNGSQPTPGYAFKLEAAEARGDEIILKYSWMQPAPDAVLAQVVTSPCSVVRLVNAGRAASVSARLDGTELGRAKLRDSAAQ